MTKNRTPLQAAVLATVVVTFGAMIVSSNASAQVYPGEGYQETFKDRAAYQALISRNGPDCPGLQERLYGKRYRCIARFGPGAKSTRDFSETLCSNIDLRMKACGLTVPKTPRGLTPAELREQDLARRGESHKP